MENESAGTGRATSDESSTRSTKGGKKDAGFDRCLKNWQCFAEAATSPQQHWFKDLLSLWCPSGHPRKDYGLRLAIRNNYLNFYRLGQSVARVYVASGELVADVHYKYVLGDDAEHSGPLYLRLTTRGVLSRGQCVATYKGLPTLLDWIKAAGGKKYAGEEKSIVDDLVGENENIIDLEMALPAWAQKTSAVRMDIVAVEDGKVAFWEVKTISDSRIRCQVPTVKDKLPEVLEQLANYRIFLEQRQHVAQVERAYLNAAKLLVSLRALADKVGPTLRLGQSIVDASNADNLGVEPRAALAVVDLLDDRGRAWKSWKASHEAKLIGIIPMRVLTHPDLLVFAGALGHS